MYPHDVDRFLAVISHRARVSSGRIHRTIGNFSIALTEIYERFSFHGDVELSGTATMRGVLHARQNHH